MNPLCRATPANRAMASMRVKLTDAKMPQGDCYVRRYVRILKSLLFSRLPDGLRLRSYCNWQIAATQKTNKKTGDDNDGKSSVIAEWPERSNYDNFVHLPLLHITMLLRSSERHNFYWTFM